MKLSYVFIHLLFKPIFNDTYHPFDDMTILGLETQDRMTLPDGNQWHVRIDKFGFKDGVYLF